MISRQQSAYVKQVAVKIKEQFVYVALWHFFCKKNRTEFLNFTSCLVFDCVQKELVENQLTYIICTIKNDAFLTKFSKKLNFFNTIKLAYKIQIDLSCQLNLGDEKTYRFC